MSDFERLKALFEAGGDGLESAVVDFLSNGQELVRRLHSEERHPDYEYDSTDTSRKGNEPAMPEGKGWELNSEAHDGGIYRDDFTDSYHWRRLKSMKQHDDIDPYSLPNVTLPKRPVSSIAEHLRSVLKDYQWPGGTGSKVLDKAWMDSEWDHAYFINHNFFVDQPEQLREAARSILPEDGSDNTLYVWTAPGLPFRLVFGAVNSEYALISIRRLSGEWGKWSLVPMRFMVPVREGDFLAALKNSKEVE